MLKIGLTGAIGSGKSIVTSYFLELKVPVIDADTIVKEIYSEDKVVLQKIENRFGVKVFTNHELNRKKLREIIFNDVDEKKWLENLLHPIVFEKILTWSKNLDAPYIIIVAPLLLETTLKDDVDRILVIDCSENLLIDRVSLRDQVSEDEVKSILNHQLSREERLAAADDVISNEGDLEALKLEVLRLHDLYSRVGKARSACPPS